MIKTRRPRPGSSEPHPRGEAPRQAAVQVAQPGEEPQAKEQAETNGGNRQSRQSRGIGDRFAISSQVMIRLMDFRSVLDSLVTGPVLLAGLVRPGSDRGGRLGHPGPLRSGSLFPRGHRGW